MHTEEVRGPPFPLQGRNQKSQHSAKPREKALHTVTFRISTAAQHSGGAERKQAVALLSALQEFTMQSAPRSLMPTVRGSSLLMACAEKDSEVTLGFRIKSATSY